MAGKENKGQKVRKLGVSNSIGGKRKASRWSSNPRASGRRGCQDL
jgi:hypothetical protein